MKTFKTIKKAFLFAFVGVLSLQTVNAQDLKLQPASSDLTVFGTSNVHDWEIEATEMQGTATLQVVDGKLEGIEKLSFIVAVEGLDSGKSGMDKNTYKALKSDDHKNIQYTLTSVKEITDKGNNQYTIATSGKLTITGVTKQVSLNFDAVLSGGKLTLKGKTGLKMTTFDVDPPTAMFGSIKTGDEVTIEYQVNYQ